MEHRDETEGEKETPRPSSDEDREGDEELDKAERKAEETRKRAQEALEDIERQKP
jgi:hypothetical protein